MSVLLWEQHNVGDAGFRTETRYSVFYRTHEGAPLTYVPIVAGTDPSTAVREVAETFPNVSVIAEPRDGFEFAYGNGGWIIRQQGALGV